MNRLFPERISFKLGVATFVVGAVLGALALLLITYFDLRSETHDVDEQLDTIMTVSLPSARRAVHLYDEALAEEVVVGLLNYPFVSDVAIYDEFGAELVRRRQDVDSNPHFLQRWLFGSNELKVSRDIQLQHVTEDIALQPGRLVLRVDQSVIYAPFWDRTLRHLLQISLLAVMLSVVLMLVFYLMVAKPLSQFAASFAQIDPTNPGAGGLDVPSRHRRDELGLVVQTTTELLQQIGEHIDAREQAAQELRNKDLYVRQILNDSPIGITVVNRQHRPVFVNRRIVEMMGAGSEQQLIESDISDSFVYPEDASKVLALEGLGRVTQDSLQMERRRLDGSSWWCLMDISRMEFDGEDVSVNYHYDITERVKAEEENKRLEHRLEQSKRLEMVGTLAGGIAHDFNNILTPILGYAQMAMDDLAPDNPLHGDLQEIEKAAKRAKKLIQQVLNFSRKRSGTHSEVVLEELIMDGVSLIRASMPKTIELDLQLLTPGLKVWGDPSQLDQVLMNLLTNAVDAIGESPGQLTVALEDYVVDRDFAATHPQIKPGLYAKIAITDNGCGIDPATQERIFDPFFTTKEPGKGSGIGLATCHRITTDHEGLVTVYSEEGQGSTFSVLLPTYDPSQRPEGSRLNTSEAIAAIQAEAQGRGRIVYVDDDDKNARFAERLLFRLGYDVTVYTSPRYALEKIRSQPQSLDLLISDRSMPDLSGYELIEQVRELRPDLPVILVSGFTVGENDQPKDLNISGFISKPFEKDEVAEMLERLLNPADEA
ncbi:ATP-binding protein [Motiliproteus sp.]|uniref:ATP-binding protein n=1 Tax=Motiliproteus sp. TaxID=1898955 RepID=UPI003BA91C17